MTTVLHAGPILVRGDGFAFETFCPAEGEAFEHTYATRSQAATDRGAMRRGIEMAGGTFTTHPTQRAFDRVMRRNGR